MARSTRLADATSTSTAVHHGSTITPSTPASSSFPDGSAASTSAAATALLGKRVSRRRQSTSTTAGSTAPSTPFTPGPVTPAEQPFTPLATNIPAFPASSSIHGRPSLGGAGQASRGAIEPKSHQLRSVGGAADRTVCPFPNNYGGKERCGVMDEDENDEVLMAACAACAMMGNRALSPDELAEICFSEGWLRPPTAAVERATPFNTSIRNHLKRCEKALPVRQPLLQKHQLAGSVAETILEPALHPDAFADGKRPKGTVYFLTTAGKLRWKNPFEGIEVPRPPPKKVGSGVKKGKEKGGKDGERKGKVGRPKASDKEARGRKSKSSSEAVTEDMPAPVAPIKIRLVLNPTAAAIKKESAEADRQAEEEDTDMGTSRSTSVRSSSEDVLARAVSVEPPAQSLPANSKPAPTAVIPKRKPRRPSSYLDSSDDSDTTDSEPDSPGPSRLPPRLGRPRRAPPAPITIGGGSPRFSHLAHRLPQSSPFRDLFFPSPLSSTFPTCPPLPNFNSSPFPTHSLDNTFWTARADRAIETSSSSSDDDMRDPDWGQNSGVLVCGEDEEHVVWAGATAEEDEAKVKEATEALRVLFPMSLGQDAEMEEEPDTELNQLDNKPLVSDTASVADSILTAVPLAHHLISPSTEFASVPLSVPWPSSSSPIPSPRIRALPLAPESSPTQHLSRSPLEADDMDIDEESSAWLDESGEGPVRADPEDISDSELVSQLGDAPTPTPECDRRKHTAEWAREAAVSTAYRVKEEVVDYPSPVTTEEGDDLTPLSNGSRASSASAEASPSSRSSEVLQDYVEVDAEPACGPESILVEEIDGLMSHSQAAQGTQRNKADKTPQRRGKSKHATTTREHRCSGNWGSIGVAGAALMRTVSPLRPVSSPGGVKTRSVRSTRRRGSNTGKEQDAMDHALPTPPPTEAAESSPARPSEDVPRSGSAQLDEDQVEDAVGGEVLDDGIGTADLEAAREEAEARDEARRKALKERAEQKRALLEAYRQRITDASDPSTPLPFTGSGGCTPSPWLDLSINPWGSNSVDSLNLMTPGSGSWARGVMSPTALHSMSSLTLKDLPRAFGRGEGVGVDPRALQSPPPGIAVEGLMGGMHLSQELSAGQAMHSAYPLEMDHAMASAQISPETSMILPSLPLELTSNDLNSANFNFGGSMVIDTDPSIQAPASMSGSTGSISPLPPLPGSVGSLETPSTSTSTLSPAPTLPGLATAATSASLTPLPSVAPTPDPSPPSTVPPSATQPIAPAPPPASSATAGTAPTPAQIQAQAQARAKAPQNPGSASVRLIHNVDACVVDHIPCFALSTSGKLGKVTVLRRMDTAFVNATMFLFALGIPLNRQRSALNLHRHPTWFAARHTVAERPKDSPIPYSPGVAGVWIQLDEAMALAKRYKLSEESNLHALLKNEAPEAFRKITKHQVAFADKSQPHFGTPFVVGQIQTTPSQSAPSSASSSTTNLPGAAAAAATAAAGSPAVRAVPPAASASRNPLPPTATATATKLAPPPAGPVHHRANSSSVASSAPMTGAAASAMGGKTLIRPATTIPEGCPQPKRRRATVVGQSPMKATGTATGGLAPIRPAPIPGDAILTSPTSLPAIPASLPTPSAILPKLQARNSSTTAPPPVATSTSQSRPLQPAAAQVSPAPPPPSPIAPHSASAHMKKIAPTPATTPRSPPIVAPLAQPALASLSGPRAANTPPPPGLAAAIVSPVNAMGTAVAPARRATRASVGVSSGSGSAVTGEGVAAKGKVAVK